MADGRKYENRYVGIYLRENDPILVKFGVSNHIVTVIKMI